MEYSKLEETKKKLVQELERVGKIMKNNYNKCEKCKSYFLTENLFKFYLDCYTVQTIYYCHDDVDKEVEKNPKLMVSFKDKKVKIEILK